MQLFDRVEKRTINGVSEVFAVDEQADHAYLLRNVIINTSNSTLEGLILTIMCYPEEYVYRGIFKTKKEVHDFSNNVIRLINEASKNNHTTSRN